MKVLQNLTNDFPALKSHSKFKLIEKGKWYHFQRVYLIKSSDGNYGLISLNFFERLLRNVCKVNYFKKAFEGRSITVINPKELNALEQKINDRTKVILTSEPNSLNQGKVNENHKSAILEHPAVTAQKNSIATLIRAMEEHLSSELEKINLKDLKKAYIQMSVGGVGANRYDINLAQEDFLSKFKEYASSVLHSLKPLFFKHPINVAYSVLLEDKNGKFYAMANTLSAQVSEDRIQEGGTLNTFEAFENKEKANNYIQIRMERFKGRI